MTVAVLALFKQNSGVKYVWSTCWERCEGLDVVCGVLDHLSSHFRQVMSATPSSSTFAPSWVRSTGSTHKLVRNAGPSILSPSLSTNRWIPWTLLCTLKIWMETLSLSEVNALSSSVPAPSADISTWTDRRTWWTTSEERLGSFSPLEIVETHDDCLRKKGKGGLETKGGKWRSRSGIGGFRFR